MIRMTPFVNMIVPLKLYGVGEGRHKLRGSRKGVVGAYIQAYLLLPGGRGRRGGNQAPEGERREVGGVGQHLCDHVLPCHDFLEQGTEVLHA